MDNLVLLGNFIDPNEAHIVKGLLESEGIPSFIFGELAAAFVPLPGSIRLMVRESDLEKARNLLSREND
ncbi:MAG: DUF2007 domain-containing protein [Bacillota bacterium]